MTVSISVILTTYNWPRALDRVLHGLSVQNYDHFEVIIADDGSTEESAQLIHQWSLKSRFPIVHCWQPDDGFRAAMIRNRAVAKAQYDYLLFMDGDCVPGPHFIKSHAHLAEKGWFVAGNRVLLTQSFTEVVFKNELAIENWSTSQWFRASLTRKCNRIFPMISLPLGKLRKSFARSWKGVKTCNVGVWREDYIKVNGIDEAYTGWGYEDSDLVVRLLRSGLFRKSGKFATEVFHLWHPLQVRQFAERNAKQLQNTLASAHVIAAQGVDQYLHYEHSNCTKME